MKMYIFGAITNIIAAVVLFGVGALEMNNLAHSIPAILCLIAAFGMISNIRKDKNNEPLNEQRASSPKESEKK